MKALVAFIASIAFWPGIPGMALTPRFAFLSIAVPSSLYVLNPKPSLRCWPVLALLAYAGVSLYWTTSLWDGLFAFGWLLTLAGIGWIGAAVRDLRPIYFGAALGVGVTSALIVLQLFGIDPVAQLTQVRQGLMFNPNIVTETAVLVFIACVMTRQYWVSLLTLPSIFLTHSRGGLLALAVAALWWAWTRSPFKALVAALAIAAGALYLVSYNTGDPADFRGGKVVNFQSVTDRINIWEDVVDQLTWRGTGIGSFRYEFPKANYKFNVMIKGRTDHAHNDFLELASELGIAGSVLALIILAMAFRGTAEPEKLILVAFLTEALVQFPMWMPLTGALGALAIGRLMRD